MLRGDLIGARVVDATQMFWGLCWHVCLVSCDMSQNVSLPFIVL